MATSQDPDKSQDISQNITPEEFQAQITSGLISADGVATQSIADLKLVHGARVAHLTRTAAFLEAKYGANDPRVKEAQDAVAAEKVTVARVSMVHQQVSTPAPQVANTGWALHGRVFDAQMQPVAGYTVFLVDAQKNYQQAYGFAYTDNTGYFLINYPGAQATQSAAVGAAAPQLFVAIVDASAQPVYLSTRTFQPTIAMASYQNILPGGKPIGDPPPEIRDVAIPSPKKNS